MIAIRTRRESDRPIGAGDALGAYRDDGDDSRSALCGDFDPILDEDARAAYKKRLAEIEPRLEQAKISDDHASIAALEGEAKFIEAQLRASRGLGGKARSMPNSHKKASDSVRNAIDRALKSIKEQLPLLDLHLSKKMNRKDGYRYDPESTRNWAT